MSLTRLGSDLSLPQKDFSQYTVTLAVTNTAQALTATRSMAESVLIYAPLGNVAAVNVGPTSGASYRPLAAGDEFRIPLNPGTQFNMGAWYAKGTAGDTLVVIYQ